MPSVDPVMPMTAMVVILPRPADRREPGSPTLDLVCRERTCTAPFTAPPSPAAPPLSSPHSPPPAPTPAPVIRGEAERVQHHKGPTADLSRFEDHLHARPDSFRTGPAGRPYGPCADGWRQATSPPHRDSPCHAAGPVPSGPQPA